MAGVKGSKFKGRSIPNPSLPAFTGIRGAVPNPGPAFVPPDARSRTRRKGK